MARHSFTGLGTFPIVVFFVIAAAEIGTPAPIEAADNSTVIVANCPLELTANLDLISSYSKRTAEGIRGAAEMFADSDESLDFEVNKLLLCMQVYKGLHPWSFSYMYT